MNIPNWVKRPSVYIKLSAAGTIAVAIVIATMLIGSVNPLMFWTLAALALLVGLWGVLLAKRLAAVQAARDVATRQAEDFRRESATLQQQLNDLHWEKEALRQQLDTTHAEKEALWQQLDYIRAEFEKDHNLVGIVTLLAEIARDLPAKGVAGLEPELGLIRVVADKLISKRAIDIGAFKGEFAATMAQVGLTVVAFEPNPSLVADLRKRFLADTGVQVLEYAISDFSGEADLHLAKNAASDEDSGLFSTLVEHPVFEGFIFEGSFRVKVTTLDACLEQGLVPKEVGILKIDTEGNDLKVLKGATLIDAEIIQLEYWNRHFVFNVGKTRNDIEDYHTLLAPTHRYSLALWRGADAAPVGIILHPLQSPPRSWGNVLFFKNESVFRCAIAALLRGGDYPPFFAHLQAPMLATAG